MKEEKTLQEFHNMCLEVCKNIENFVEKQMKICPEATAACLISITSRACSQIDKITRTTVATDLILGMLLDAGKKLKKKSRSVVNKKKVLKKKKIVRK